MLAWATLAIKLVFENRCHAESMRETLLPGTKQLSTHEKENAMLQQKVIAEPVCALDYKDLVRFGRSAHCACKVLILLFCKVLVSEHIGKCDLGGVGTHATLAMRQP